MLPPSTDINNNLYIHAIPCSVRDSLCAILDENNGYQKLAKLMKYDTAAIQKIKQSANLGKSPSDALLTKWSTYNHTVDELFYLLYKMKSFVGMETIIHLVACRYHGHLPKLKPITENGISDFVSEIPYIDYDELEVATNNWNEQYQLGKGGFGTVYQGDWRKTQVAIKRLTVMGNKKMNELKFLNATRHDNILALYGYSMIQGKPPCLVCQLMPGRSLEFRLMKNNEFPPLSWRQRLVIAQGTARGLQFLHTSKSKPLIHGDIKPANILLDSCCQPKIADFGLAREISISSNYASISMVSRVLGTRAYLPREFIKDHLLSTKVDTYSFGVVLYQLVTGKKAHDPERKPFSFLTDYIGWLISRNVLAIDELCDHMDPEGTRIARILTILGQQCTKESPARPEMVEILEYLDAIRLKASEQN